MTRSHPWLVAVISAGLLLAGLPLSAAPVAARQAVAPPTITSSGPSGVVAREISTTINGSRVLLLPIAASAVALHWTGAPGAHVGIALAVQPGRYGADLPVVPDEEGPGAPGETYGSVAWAGGARYLRITSDRPINRLTVVAFGPPGSGVNVSAPGTAPEAAVAQNAVISRGGWGANESLRLDAAGHERWPANFYPLQKIFIHHTAGRNGDPDPAATIRAIYYYHAVTRGWGDIGYNFLIDEAGHIYEGRRARTYGTSEPPTSEDQAGNVVRGAHAASFNDGTIGIALLGTFTSQLATAAARAALESLLAWETERHGIDPLGRGMYTNPVSGLTKVLNNIAGHRDVDSTACPGDLLYAALPAIRSAVATRIAAASGPLNDTAAPLVASLAPMATDPTGASTIRFGLTFKEPVTGLSATDFAVSGSSAGWSVSGVSGSAAVYAVEVSASGPADGSVVLTLAAGSVADLAANPGPSNLAEATANFAVDTTPPAVALYASPSSSTTNANAFNVTATFSEPVEGFTAVGVLVGGSSQAATPWTVGPLYGSGATYSFGVYLNAPANGTLTITLPAAVATDLAGNPNIDSNLLSTTIDRTAPSTSTPLARLRSSVTMSTTALPANLAWTGSDPGGSGIKTYDLARSVDGAAFSVIATGLTASQANVTLVPGHTYRYEVRARDAVGNVGAWAAGPTLRPALTQQSSTSISYHGTWYTVTSSVYSGGTARYGRAAGASASLTVSARTIAFVTSRGPTRGVVKVYVDGILAETVDLYAASGSYRRVAFSQTWSSVGTHTIKIVVMGTAGRPRVDLDAFEILR